MHECSMSFSRFAQTNVQQQYDCEISRCDGEYFLCVFFFPFPRVNSVSWSYFGYMQEEGLHETNVFMEEEDTRAEVKLRTTLEELASGCMKYVSISKNSITSAGSGKTKLDKERMKLCQREIVRVSLN